MLEASEEPEGLRRAEQGCRGPQQLGPGVQQHILRGVSLSARIWFFSDTCKSRRCWARGCCICRGHLDLNYPTRFRLGGGTGATGWPLECSTAAFGGSWEVPQGATVALLLRRAAAKVLGAGDGCA